MENENLISPEEMKGYKSPVVVLGSGEIVDLKYVDEANISIDDKAVYKEVLSAQYAADILWLGGKNHGYPVPQAKLQAMRLRIDYEKHTKYNPEDLDKYSVDTFEMTPEQAHKACQRAVYKDRILQLRDSDYEDMSVDEKKQAENLLLKMYVDAGGNIADFIDATDDNALVIARVKKALGDAIEEESKVDTVAVAGELWAKNMIDTISNNSESSDRAMNEVVQLMDELKEKHKDSLLPFSQRLIETIEESNLPDDQKKSVLFKLRDYHANQLGGEPFWEEDDKDKQVGEIVTDVKEELLSSILGTSNDKEVDPSTTSTQSNSPSPTRSARHRVERVNIRGAVSGVSKKEVVVASVKNNIDINDEVVLKRSEDIAEILRSETVDQQKQGFFKRTIRNIWQNNIAKYFYDKHAKATVLAGVKMVHYKNGALISAGTYIDAEREARRRVEGSNSILSRARGMFSVKHDRIAKETLKVLEEWVENGDERIDVDRMQTNMMLDSMATAVSEGAVDERLGETLAKIDLSTDSENGKRIKIKLTEFAQSYLYHSLADDITEAPVTGVSAKNAIEVRKEIDHWLLTDFRNLLTDEQRAKFAESASFGSDLFAFFDGIRDELKDQVESAVDHQISIKKLDVAINEALQGLDTLVIGTKESGHREKNGRKETNRRRAINNRIRDWGKNSEWMEMGADQVLDIVDKLTIGELVSGGAFVAAKFIGQKWLARTSIVAMPILAGLKAGKRTKDLRGLYERWNAEGRGFVESSSKKYEKFRSVSTDKRDMGQAMDVMYALMYQYDDQNRLVVSADGTPELHKPENVEELLTLAVSLADLDARVDLEFSEREYLFKAGDNEHKTYAQERNEIDILRARSRRYLKDTLTELQTSGNSLYNDFIQAFGNSSATDIDAKIGLLKNDFKANLLEGKRPVGAYQNVLQRMHQYNPALAEQIFTGHLNIKEDEKSGNWLKRTIVEERTRNRSIKMRQKALNRLALWEGGKALGMSALFMGVFSAGVHGATLGYEQVVAMTDGDPATVGPISTLIQELNSGHGSSSNHITDFNHLHISSGEHLVRGVNTDSGFGVDFNSNGEVEMINPDGSHIPLTGIDGAGQLFKFTGDNIFDGSGNITTEFKQVLADHHIHSVVQGLNVNHAVSGNTITVGGQNVSLPPGVIVNNNGHLLIDRIGNPDIDLGDVDNFHNPEDVTNVLKHFGWQSIHTSSTNEIPGIDYNHFHEVSIPGTDNAPEVILPKGVKLEIDPNNSGFYQFVAGDNHQVIADHIQIGDNGIENIAEVSKQLQQHGCVPVNNNNGFFTSVTDTIGEVHSGTHSVGTEQYLSSHANGHNVYHAHTLHGETSGDHNALDEAVKYGTDQHDALAELRLGYGGNGLDVSGNYFVDGSGYDSDGNIHMVQDAVRSYELMSDGSQYNVDLLGAAKQHKVFLLISGKGDHFVGEGSNAIRDEFFVVEGTPNSAGYIDYNISPDHPAFPLFKDGHLLPGVSAQTAVINDDNYVVADIIANHQDNIPVDIVSTYVADGELPEEVTVPVGEVVKKVVNATKLELGAPPTIEGIKFGGYPGDIHVLVPEAPAIDNNYGIPDIFPFPSPGKQIERPDKINKKKPSSTQTTSVEMESVAPVDEIKMEPMLEPSSSIVPSSSTDHLSSDGDGNGNGDGDGDGDGNGNGNENGENLDSVSSVDDLDGLALGSVDFLEYFEKNMSFIIEFFKDLTESQVKYLFNYVADKPLEQLLSYWIASPMSINSIEVKEKIQRLKALSENYPDRLSKLEERLDIAKRRRKISILDHNFNNDSRSFTWNPLQLSELPDKAVGEIVLTNGKNINIEVYRINKNEGLTKHSLELLKESNVTVDDVFNGSISVKWGIMKGGNFEELDYTSGTLSYKDANGKENSVQIEFDESGITSTSNEILKKLGYSDEFSGPHYILNPSRYVDFSNKEIDTIEAEIKSLKEVIHNNQGKIQKWERISNVFESNYSNFNNLDVFISSETLDLINNLDLSRYPYYIYETDGSKYVSGVRALASLKGIPFIIKEDLKDIRDEDLKNKILKLKESVDIYKLYRMNFRNKNMSDQQIRDNLIRIIKDELSTIAEPIDLNDVEQKIESLLQ